MRKQLESCYQDTLPCVLRHTRHDEHQWECHTIYDVR